VSTIAVRNAAVTVADRFYKRNFIKKLKTKQHLNVLFFKLGISNLKGTK